MAPTVFRFHFFSFEKKDNEELQQIHENMVVLCVDKSAQDLALCCKSIYLNKLWKEIHSDHYEDCTMTENTDIWARHASLSKQVYRSNK